MKRGQILQLFLLLIPVVAAAQPDASANSYLLRMIHGTLESHACVLLQTKGAFHMESTNGDSTRVIEGSLSAGELQQLERDLNDNALESLSQKQIEEPLISHREFLQINVFRNDHWQDLNFLSIESRQPYQKSLQPLLQWLENLHRLPHKELSEEEGKNNCQAPGKIELKKRINVAPVTSAETNPPHELTLVPKATPPAPKVQSTPALLRVLSMSMKSGVAQQRCVLINENGAYRTEELTQKTDSKKVDTKIDGGQMTPTEVSELQQILADPALARIHHHETSRVTLPMSGEMLNLEMYRSSGLQDVVLSSTFNRRDVPFFYSGDGDIANARPLLKFLAEHVENNQLGALDPGLRNDCQDAP